MNTEPRWYVIDNTRISKWYYRDPPAIGSWVHYMDDTYADTIDHVTPFAVWFTSGRAMRRPYIIERSLQWTIDTARSWNTARRTEKARTLHPLGRSALAG